MNAAKRGNVMTLKTIAAYAAEEPLELELELELDMHKELPAFIFHKQGRARQTQ